MTGRKGKRHSPSVSPCNSSSSFSALEVSPFQSRSIPPSENTVQLLLVDLFSLAELAAEKVWFKCKSSHKVFEKGPFFSPPRNKHTLLLTTLFNNSVILAGKTRLYVKECQLRLNLACVSQARSYSRGQTCHLEALNSANSFWSSCNI